MTRIYCCLNMDFASTLVIFAGSVCWLTCALSDHDVVDATVPVVSQLRFPGKVAHVHDGVPHEQVDDVACMDVQDDEGVDLAPQIR